MKKLFLCLLCLLPLQAAYAQRIERSFPAPVPAGLSTMIALTASDGQNRQNPQPVSWLPYGLPNGNEALAGVKTARRVDVYSYGAQNQWVFSSANAYTFNAAGLVGTYVGFYPGPADSSSLVYYTYNNRGQPLCYLRKIRTRSGLWHNDSRTNYEYDTFGNTVAYGAAYYDTLINQFINFDSASTTYTYSAGSVFTKRRIWRINSYNRPWVIIDSVLTSGPIGEPLELIERNSSSAPLKMLYSGWFNWVPPLYDSGYPLVKTVENFKNGIFTDSTRETNVYNPNGSIRSNLQQVYQNGYWVNISRYWWSSVPPSTTDSVRYETWQNGFWRLRYKEAFLRLNNPDSTLAEMTVQIQYSMDSALRNYQKFVYSDYVVTGLPVAASKAGLTAYPNPFVHTLYLQIASPEAFTLTDLSGKVHIAGTLTPQNGRAALNAETLPRGMYLLNAAGSVLKVLKE